jgi:HUS1 checkpoint protein
MPCDLFHLAFTLTPLMSHPKPQAIPRPSLFSLILGLWIFPTLWLGFFIIIAYSIIHSAMGQWRMSGTSGVKAKQQQAKPSKTRSSDHIEKECLICQQRVGKPTPEGNQESWSMLPCGHRFGSHCIKRYLNIAAIDEPLCPMCRSRAYHDACGHPVLPFMLTSEGTHPDLITDDVSGELRPRQGEDFLLAACEYCRDPQAYLKRLAEAELQAELQQPRWKRQSRWLWERLSFNRKQHAEPPASVTDDNRQSTELNRQSTELNRQSTELNRQSTELNRQSTELNRQSTELNRRQRIRNQQNGGPWNGPWMDVRSRDHGWEKWWKEQAPRGM